MSQKIIAISLFLILITGQIVLSQTDKGKALSLGEKAVKLMDNGKVDESIKLLEEAQALDPDNIEYSYEMAYAYCLKKNYDKSIEIIEKYINHKDANEQFFQMLGNCYDITGKTDKALEVYDSGLKKFPNSGKIYLEKGNVFWEKKDFEKALPFYEKGIEVDPAFSSNYYRTALIYCNTTEEVWGMIYGELFMNLERNTKRTEEISKLLFDTYKSEIKITSDTSYSVSFSNNSFISSENFRDPENFKIPFGTGVYEPVIAMSIINEKSIDINSLDRVRKSFIELYYKNEINKKYPNLLFDYQKKLLDEGYLEAYNHWVLMKGDEDAFDKWYNLNEKKWEAFVTWFTKNGLKVDNSNKFYSGQYK